MQLNAKTLMNLQVPATAPAGAQAAADSALDKGFPTAAPASSWSMRDPSAMLLPAVAVLLFSASGTGLACSVDAATACMLLASMLRAGAWVYAAFIFAAAVLTAACLVRQPQQQQQQQGEGGVQEVEEPEGLQARQGGSSAGGHVSPCKEATPNTTNCFELGQSCSCLYKDCSPFELQFPDTIMVPAPTCCIPPTPGIGATDPTPTTDISSTINKSLTLTSAVSVHNCFQASEGATCTCDRDCSPFELQHDYLQPEPQLQPPYLADTGAVDASKGATCTLGARDCSPFELQQDFLQPKPQLQPPYPADQVAVDASKGATCASGARDCSPFELQQGDLQEPQLQPTNPADAAATECTSELDLSAVPPVTNNLSFSSCGLTHRLQHRASITAQVGAGKMPDLKMPAAVSTAGPVVQGCVSLDEAIVGYQRCMEVIGQLPITATLSE